MEKQKVTLKYKVTNIKLISTMIRQLGERFYELGDMYNNYLSVDKTQNITIQRQYILKKLNKLDKDLRKFMRMEC